MHIKEVNPHFDDFLFDWEQKFQFLVGGYGSSKSYHVALKLILKLLSEKQTALVVREVYDTRRDSTFSLLEEIINELVLDHKIRCVSSPMQIRFPNGSKIIFKAMDKPQKLKSIHNVSLIWLEECSEIKYEGFKELLGRLRHPSLRLHMILSTNPVGEDNWTFLHFFKDDRNKRLVLDDQDLYAKRTVIVKETFYHHSTADDNLFLPARYIEQLEEMKEYDPDLHRIAREGRFGVNGKRVLPQFEEWSHEAVMNAVKSIRKPIERVGMDFGFEDSYNAVVRMQNTRKMYVLYDDFGAIALQNIESMRLNLLVDAESGESFDYTSSIDSSTYNKIKLSYENKKSGKREIYIAQDSRTINEWGVLQFFETIQEGVNGKAKADALLSLYNQKSRKLSVKRAFGAPRVRAGSSLGVGLYLGDITVANYMVVETAKHTFNESDHYMDLRLIGGEFIA
ncbi:PBSX family phage terminase large subunit [Sporosarcina sp. resist]|uniref:PBSX family phage terminase large subunit n=1 Tax=Sporosarcina sp. resist TaxID=2762563 RepID=UPI00164DADB2|nr:PBSX family phage terminase large subunit [Sporosarcina sp. resist]